MRSLRMRKFGCSDLNRYRHISLKQVVISLLLNARKQEWVSRMLGIYYSKWMPHVTVHVRVACWSNFNARCPWVPSIGQILQSFIGDGDLSIWGKNSRARWNTPNKQYTPQDPENEDCTTFVYSFARYVCSFRWFNFSILLVLYRGVETLNCLYIMDAE